MLAFADVPADLAVVEDVMPWVGLLLVIVLFRELRNAPANLLVLMMTAFLDMAGLFLVVPLLPFYVKLFHERGETLFGLEIGTGLLTGLVVTSFTVAQLVTAPLWGRFSDRHGRRAA
ncbi:MAG: MFS transporter, partial [Planctomycetes bacterium]|nr:MFS transporter [Planctomycetota bacterium]